MSLPDFFIAGAPKSGTTALHAALARHPSLYMSAVKEPKFFLTDGPPPARGGPGDVRTYREHVWRRDDYEALFDPAPAGALRGESTPFYLYDRAAQLRIRAASLGQIRRAPLRCQMQSGCENSVFELTWITHRISGLVCGRVCITKPWPLGEPFLGGVLI